MALAAPASADGFVSRWRRVGGLRLHSRERVPPVATGAPVLLLHGLAVSHRYLMPTARRLTGRAAYVPDLAGFGLSEKPAAVLDVVGHAELTARWWDAVGGGPVAVLGNSFGCQVAVELARRRPDLVTALVLVGPTVDPRAATMGGQIRRWLRDVLREDLRETPVLLADIRDAGVRRVIATLRHSVRDPLAAKLPSLSVPTLLVRGARDPIAPRSWLHEAARLAPESRTLVLKRAAHNAVTTAGTELAEAVERFLAPIDRKCPDRPDRHGATGEG